MNNNHRYFIQFMLQRGVASLENAMEFCKFVSNDNIANPVQLKSLISEINTEITKHSFQMVFNICEVTNQEVIVWINTRNDEISKLQTMFTASELEYFHAIMQEILNSDEHRLTFIACLNVTSSLTSNLSRSNGQKALEKWMKIGYYVKKGDYVHLGPRLILEFNAYLKSHCPNAECNLCSEMVFTGKMCCNCGKTLHAICLSKYLERQNNCPCCHSEWVDPSKRTSVEENSIESNVTVEQINDYTQVTQEVPEDVFEDYTQLTEEYSNISQKRSQRLNFKKLRTRRTTEEDLLEAGPSSRRD